jgi:PBP4 family serine-type D-alanyl-D-alanine carboxypeptidase
MKRLLIILALSSAALGQQPAAAPSTRLADRLQAIMARPEYRHSFFGVKVVSLDSGKTLYEFNADKLFTPASTTKLLSEGTALAALGPDFRFHTFIYRTGELKKNGTLEGDIMLVGSGDPDLSNRIQPDGTLAFQDEDHAYGGPAVAGDPLLVIKEFAAQIKARGIKKISGHVIVDGSLFPDIKELGTETTYSPIIVNDNIVDLTVTPGAKEGDPATVNVSPQTSYLHITNTIKTGKAGTEPDGGNDDHRNADGTYSVSLHGLLPVGAKPLPWPWNVPEPARFAAVLLTEALNAEGIKAKVSDADSLPDFQKLSASYKPENVIAEHISPPFSQEVKVTLKVSQNLHASEAPLLLGATVAKKPGAAAEQAGFDYEREWLTKAGLDLSGASQSDGAGGAAYFTPDFMVSYLTWMTKQPYFKVFYDALPILGKDGTLVDIQTDSAAAGHVHAKTGTFSDANRLGRNLIVTGKGLAGYMETSKGEHLVFCLYVNRTFVPRGGESPAKRVGQMLGEMAAAAYDADF